MYSFSQLLAGVPSGLYRLNGDWRSRSLDKLCQLKGVQLVRIDGSTVRDRKRFLAVAARAMRCPAWFGANWDAFADAVMDLEWAPAGAYLVILGDMEPFAARAPQAFHLALTILEQAAQFWSERGIPFHVLVADTQGAASNALPAVGLS